MATNNKYALAIKARQDADKRQGTLPKTTNKYALGVYYNAPVADHRPSPVMRLETKNERMPVKPVASTVTVQDQYRPKTPWFTPNILNPVANQNSTLVGKATGGSAQSKKEFDFAGAEKRIAELEDKIARMQNDPSTEAVRSKQTELLVYRTQYEGLKKDYEKAKADKWYADTGNEIASSVMAGNDGLWGNLRNVAELSDLDMAERMAMNAPGVGSITTSVQDELNAAKAKLPAGVDADWLEYARHANEREAFDKSMEEARAYAEAHPVGSSVASVPLNLMSGAGGVDVLGKKLGKLITGSEAPINFQSAAMIPSAATQEIRSTVSKDMSATGSMLYNVGMSIADSAAIVGMSAFGVPGGSALLGSSAATSTMRAAAERGASENQAIALGLISGAAEAFFEKYSIDNLLTPNGARGAKAFFENFFKQGVTEMTEEGATTLANTAADFLIMGDKNELAQRKQRLIADGYSEEEANKIAGTEWFKNLGVDLLGGLISGGFFSTAKSAASGISNATNKTDSRFDEMARDIGSIMPRLPQQQFASPQSAQDTATGDIVSMVAAENNSAQGQNKNAPAVEPKRVGQASILKNPYTGDTPTYTKPENRAKPVVTVGSVKTAADNIQKAKEIGAATGKSYRNSLTDMLEKVFGNRAHAVKVNGTSFGNEDYVVSVHKNALGKLVSDPNMSAEKLAVLDVLDEVISNGEYVGSNSYVPKGKKQKLTTRFDLFETPVSIEVQTEDGGTKAVDYIVTFDVEVFPNINNYRTHKVINEMDLTPVSNADTGSDQPQGSGKQDPSNPDIPQPEQSVNGEIGNMGAKTSEFPHEVKESQSKTTPAYHEQYNIPEEGRADNHYTAVTEAESLHNARLRLEQDYEGEVAEMRAKTTWSNEEMDMGQMVLDDLRVKAEETGDWSEFREWDKVNREHKSEAGRALQALAKQNRNTATDIMSNASEALENAKDGTDTNDVMNTVSDYATRYEVVAETKNIDGLLQIIHDTSVTRKTGTRKGGLSKEIDWALKRIADYARSELANAKQTDAADVGRFYDFLQNFAANGIEAIATDTQRISFGAGYRTIQHNSILSKFATVARNLASNGVLDPLDSFAGNLAVPLDALLSKFTKTRSVAVDKSWISETKRKGSMDGLAMALLEIGLDVNSDGAVGKYEDVGKRTFHMSNGGIAKLISTWEKYSGYLMTATDEFSKGGVEAEVQRGIDSLYEQGKIKDDTLKDAGEQAARYRTLQDETAPSKVVSSVRNALNHAQAGGLGLGDVTIKFAQVPANLPARAADFSPVGLVRGVGKLAKVLIDAKNGKLTAAQQASAVKDIGRGITGSGMIYAATALALKGIIHVVSPGGEEENKDKAASEQAQGLKETQINLSALLRAIKGEDTAWQADDEMASLGFLDPINAHLMTGALIAEDIEAARKAGENVKFGDILKDSLQGTVHALLDLPLMDPIKDIANAWQYSDGENDVERGLDVVNTAVAGEVASFIPNFLKGIAQGTDEYQRDLYAKDDVVGQVVDNIVGSIPGLRQKFTTKKQDVYGNDVKNPDQPLNFLNANILPGAITTYSETDLQAALNALAEETGVNSMYLSKNPPKSISVDGTKVELTDEQQRQFMTDRGDQYESASAALEADETYKDFSGEWKLKAYEYAEDYATQKAKEGLEAGFKPDTWVSDLEGATPEEFSEALVQRVVENIAGKAGENKYLGLENLLDNGSIDDQLALACMSESANEAYTTICKDAGISVQQFLDAYGNAQAGGENAYERKQAALDYIDTLDLDAKTASKLALGVHTAIGTTAKLETEVPEDYLLSIGAIEQFEAQMSKTQKEDYDKYIKGSGVNLDLYQKTWDFSNSDEAKGEKDKDGKDIKGKTHRDKVIDYIAGLNCSEDDKDAIFLALGYSKKNLPRTWK